MAHYAQSCVRRAELLSIPHGRKVWLLSFWHHTHLYLLSKTANFKKGLTRHKNPLTTLKHETQPSSERFLPFLPHYVDSDDPKTLKCYRATRQVVRDRVQFGKVILAVGTGHWNAGDGELRLCPYFEPKSKTLKFQQLDGTDYPEVRELPTLLSSPCYRPTLLLAHDEELLDSVPG